MLLIQDGNQAFFCQAALNQGGNNQAVTRDLSASRKWLVSCRVERNMTTKKGKHISTYSKIREEVSRDEKKRKQYCLWRQRKQTEKGMEYRKSTLH